MLFAAVGLFHFCSVFAGGVGDGFGLAGQVGPAATIVRLGHRPLPNDRSVSIFAGDASTIVFLVSVNLFVPSAVIWAFA